MADTGYWAESLPLMDAPLCAVIDPIRDYRWHALRCGGPETASFLCEMPGKSSKKREMKCKRQKTRKHFQNRSSVCVWQRGREKKKLN